MTLRFLKPDSLSQVSYKPDAPTSACIWRITKCTHSGLYCLSLRFTGVLATFNTFFTEDEVHMLVREWVTLCSQIPVLELPGIAKFGRENKAPPVGEVYGGLVGMWMLAHQI